MNGLIDDLTKSAPAGSEAIVSAMKACVANSNAAYEQFVKVSQTAFDNFQEQLHQAGNQFSAGTTKPAKAKKSAA